MCPKSGPKSLHKKLRHQLLRHQRICAARQNQPPPLDNTPNQFRFRFVPHASAVFSPPDSEVQGLLGCRGSLPGEGDACAPGDPAVAVTSIAKTIFYISFSSDFLEICLRFFLDATGNAPLRKGLQNTPGHGLLMVSRSDSVSA